VIKVPASTAIPDHLASPILPPSKWYRLDLQLPSFEFTPASANSDAQKATKELNSAIQQQLANWAISNEEEYGGQHWGYRHGIRVRPSDIQNWKSFLERARSAN